MRLTYLKIQHFGKLREKEIFLEDGINVIYGPNESGKSTLHAFIRGMLFGMPRYRGRASKTDPYTRYEPWERPADYAGSMRFLAGGKEFRIDRNFYKGDVRESLVCETDGEQLSVAQGDLQMLLGGISESVYDNTVSIGQLRSETDEGMVRELQNHMSNYEQAGSSDVDVQRAGERLRKKKKDWEAKVRTLEKRQERQIEELENQIGYVRREQEKLEEQLEKVRSEKQEWKKRYAAAERRRKEEPQKLRSNPEDEEREAFEEELIMQQEAEEQRRREAKGSEERSGREEKNGKRMWLPLMILGCFLLGLAVVDPFSLGIVLQIVFGIVGVGMVIPAVRIRERSVQPEQEEEALPREKERPEPPVYQPKDTAAETEQQLLKMQAYIGRLLGREDTLLQQIEEKSVVVQNLLENREDFRIKPQEITNAEIEIQSLNLAMEMLEKLSGGMRRRIGRRLQSRMEEILREITEGRYGQISVDENMKISLYERGRQIGLHQVSRGTVEQVYFALRMAVSEVLCEEQMPVILDDVFAMYDEQRLMQTLRWLLARGGQVILLTCHRREAQLLREMQVKCNLINLEETSC